MGLLGILAAFFFQECETSQPKNQVNWWWCCSTSYHVFILCSLNHSYQDTSQACRLCWDDNDDHYILQMSVGSSRGFKWQWKLKSIKGFDFFFTDDGINTANFPSYSKKPENWNFCSNPEQEPEQIIILEKIIQWAIIYEHSEFMFGRYFKPTTWDMYSELSDQQRY